MPAFGCVPYLNAKPLICGLPPDSIDFRPPSELDPERYDAALVPVFRILQSDSPQVVDGVGIACDGEVLSVIVAPEPGPGDLIAPDPHSRTSNALLRVLCSNSEFHVAEPGTLARCRLIIGDPALEFRQLHPSTPVKDLGQWWKELTGLPFVFALWQLHPHANPTLANHLRQCASRGIAQIDSLAAREPLPALASHYLKNCIHYQITHREKTAIHRFAQSLPPAILPSPASLHWV